jgi:shikimate kinase
MGYAEKDAVHIVLLTGPKHSGKTKAGRALAAAWGAAFIDSDELVETRTGKTPRLLFKEGPEIFRKAEAEALAEILQTEKLLVVAAGGGLIDNAEALALLENRPRPSARRTLAQRPSARGLFVVYLEVSAETAWRRILKAAAGGELPPFLNTANPRETHRDLHGRRARGYKAMAGLVVNAEGKSPAEIAGEILAGIGGTNRP